ncbi:hypothetical protein ADEAN_000015200 [Angomonas deanei]|uniref:Uncharacterized protein n=1 Tax=Angomonas deanei TaxID=59799 RepID=A0A7G2BZ76_9TRYP|nr:hypothetical protein ADEAN_000015200 [Angomonas deanei]
MPPPRSVVCALPYYHVRTADDQSSEPTHIVDVRLQFVFFDRRHVMIHLSAFPNTLDVAEREGYVPLLGPCAVSTPCRLSSEKGLTVSCTNLFLETPFGAHISDDGLQSSFAHSLSQRLTKKCAGDGVVFIVHCALEPPLSALLLGGEGSMEAATQFSAFVYRNVLRIVQEENEKQ